MGVDLVAAVNDGAGHADVLDALDVGADLDAEGGEDLAGDRTGHHAQTVSRAEARPPPRTSRSPYLASYVKSAWEGRNVSFRWS